MKEPTCFDIPKVKSTTKDDYELRSHMFNMLMPFKVREILLVSSLYDAFIIEEEGLISELVIEEYRHLLLSSPPRVTRVSSGKDALEKLKNKSYDLIITMSKNIGMDPFIFGKKIKKSCPKIPVILLATDTPDLAVVQQKKDRTGIDKIFFWNGDSNLFLSIIKCVEDRVNAPYDTKNGNVQVIIFVEDSIRFYSMFLPKIYTAVVEQTQRSLSEDITEMQRLLRRRGRPKILLAETYEEGMHLYKKFKHNVLGIVSDIKFPRNNKEDASAGIQFIHHVKTQNPFIPIMLQSSDPANRMKAEEMNVYFLDKNSTTLLQDFQHFIMNHLGFGDFVFLVPKKDTRDQKKSAKDHILDEQTREIGHASNMKEFETVLQKIPLESIQYHANRNDFSNWLMARGEFKLATMLRPRKVSDFSNLDEMRKHLTKAFNEARKERRLGVITDFEEERFEFESTFTRLGGTSLGGKGRGIAFIRSLLARYNLEKKYADVKLVVPNTVVIGTEQFDAFLEENELYSVIEDTGLTDREIAQKFLSAQLPQSLREKLQRLLDNFSRPIAVRSSSLLEDSQNFPFAGLYSTYMLPNNHTSNDFRLQQLMQAIKLIYSSVFYKDARVYIESTASKIEEEKMAIIIQELIGQNKEGSFYPTFSGVAQSYNFYPISRQKAEEGIASVAVGLGYAVVGGEKTLRFSPKHPHIIPEFASPKQIMDNSQRDVHVLNIDAANIALTENEHATLKKLSVEDIRTDDAMNYLVSSFDRNDGVIRDGNSSEGPLFVTFSGILKQDMFPLAALLNDLLFIGQQGMGCPVELEFAVEMNENTEMPPTFAVLQIRPLILSQEQAEITWDDSELEKEQLLLHSEQSLGNGLIENIADIVFVLPSKFSSAKTVNIAKEVAKINAKLTQSDAPYLLIGPGRWGTQDPWLGMPVRWSQISGVKIMVETPFEDFYVEPTQGTHFFQNIISRGIGYITMTSEDENNFIDWEWLETQQPVTKLKYVSHIHLSQPLTVKLDGRNRRAVILKP